MPLEVHGDWEAPKAPSKPSAAAFGERFYCPSNGAAYFPSCFSETVCLAFSAGGLPCSMEIFHNFALVTTCPGCCLFLAPENGMGDGNGEGWVDFVFGILTHIEAAFFVAEPILSLHPTLSIGSGCLINLSSYRATAIATGRPGLPSRNSAAPLFFLLFSSARTAREGRFGKHTTSDSTSKTETVQVREGRVKGTQQRMDTLFRREHHHLLPSPHF